EVADLAVVFHVRQRPDRKRQLRAGFLLDPSMDPGGRLADRLDRQRVELLLLERRILHGGILPHGPFSPAGLPSAAEHFSRTSIRNSSRPESSRANGDPAAHQSLRSEPASSAEDNEKSAPSASPRPASSAARR